MDMRITRGSHKGKKSKSEREKLKVLILNSCLSLRYMEISKNSKKKKYKQKSFDDFNWERSTGCLLKNRNNSSWLPA